MGLGTARAGANRGAAVRRRIRRLAGALGVGPYVDAPTTDLASALIVALAAVPFAGWVLPALWLLPMATLAALVPAWARRRPAAGDRLDPYRWLIVAGHSIAAFYLVAAHVGAAQTLGVTLYGVTMFKVLARDYDAPRRLMVNLLAPMLAVVVVQVFAAALLIQAGQPWRIVTLMASPYIVYRGFRAVQHHLVRSRAQERSALAQLSESETRYRLLAESSPDLLIRIGMDGRFEYLSPAARNYGYEPEALVGCSLSEFLEPDDCSRLQAWLDAKANGRPPSQAEEDNWRTWKANGEPIVFQGAPSPIWDDDGRMLGAMAVMRDVTARLALEEELRRKQAEAEAAAVAKSQFLANMSHEIRTPLTGVIGFAGLLDSREDLPADAQRYVDRIHKSAQSLLAVVNDVLDFSKLEANQVEIDPQPLALRPFLDETVDLIRHQAGAKGLSVTLEAAGLPERVLADGARLRQVLLNLLTNAVKFTETGVIVVACAPNAADGRLRFEVRDSGIGVPAEVAGRLFQRFSQVDGSSTRQHGGSGLGLAICKGLVEMMGGEIGMESRHGAGSTFWFTLQAPPVEAPREPDAEAAPAQARAAELAGEAPSRILVVDDVAANRELVAAMLTPFEVQLVEAATGAAAIQAALEAPFDLILMDLQMPGMDGMAAAAAIRARCDRNRCTPILALSANVLPAHVEACLAAGMDDHVSKPIDPRELLGKIAKWTSPEARAEDAQVGRLRSQQADGGIEEPA